MQICGVSDRCRHLSQLTHNHIGHGLILVVLLLCCHHAVPVAAESLCFYDRDVFRIVYSLEGDAAVPHTDINRNGLPDVVEDTATQLLAAREAFASLGFPDPLQSIRYAGTTGIMVIMLPRSTMHGHHDRAFSRASGSRHYSGKWLKIHISTDTNPVRNPTPAHEYFHLIQYAHSRFMNGWYLEGMARWAEDVVNRVFVDPGISMNTEKAIRESYTAAENLWHPLGIACSGAVRIPRSLTDKYRYVDGTVVFKDDVINGHQAMAGILACLNRKEPAAAEAGGGVANWRKNGQRSPLNTPYILDCVREIHNQCTRFPDMGKRVY